MVVGHSPRGNDRPGRLREKLKSTLLPIWLDPKAPTCSLYVVEQAVEEDWTNVQMARAICLSRRGFNFLLLKAKTKLAEQHPSLMEFLEADHGPAMRTRTRMVVRQSP